jgi:biotin synthase
LEVVISFLTNIRDLEEKVVRGGYISKQEASQIPLLSGPDIFYLFAAANKIRTLFRGNNVGLCSIINAKSGSCSEDCSFCAQSSGSKASIEVYPLLNKEILIQKAIEAKSSGAKRFSLVTSGRTVLPKDLLKIADMISSIKEIGLAPCASLGLLDKDDLLLLKQAGLDRYHHNLETAERLFSRICSTHHYADKVVTIKAAQSVGLSICSGGIFGLGETWEDRIDMGLALRELGVESIPINFLIPVQGTASGDLDLLHPFEALQIVSLYRFLLPQKEIRICGGRMQVLGEFNSLVFTAGADGMITGNYLTTVGRSPADDLKLIELCGLVP